MDPTRPMHDKEVTTPIQGRFVDYGAGVLLSDLDGNTHTLDHVRIIPGLWGGKEEGQEKWPRPWIYDPVSGEAIEEGDHVLIWFLDGSYQTPIVMGCARAINANEIYTQDQRGGNVNRYFARAASLAAGVSIGSAQVEHENGAANVRASGSLELSAGLDLGGVASIKTTLADGVCSVSLLGALPLSPPLRGDTFLTDLSAVMVELAAALAALSLTDTATLAMIANITASALLGPPYLSTTLKSE